MTSYSRAVIRLRTARARKPRETKGKKLLYITEVFALLLILRLEQPALITCTCFSSAMNSADQDSAAAYEDFPVPLNEPHTWHVASIGKLGSTDLQDDLGKSDCWNARLATTLA